MKGFAVLLMLTAITLVIINSLYWVNIIVFIICAIVSAIAGVILILKMEDKH